MGCAMEVVNELGHGLLEKPYDELLENHRLEDGGHPELQTGETGMEESCLVKECDQE